MVLGKVAKSTPLDNFALPPVKMWATANFMLDSRVFYIEQTSLIVPDAKEVGHYEIRATTFSIYELKEDGEECLCSYGAEPDAVLPATEEDAVAAVRTHHFFEACKKILKG